MDDLDLLDLNTVDTEAAAWGGGSWTFYWIVVIIMVVSLWKLFIKAGRPGWAAIIPIYNTLVMIQLAGKPWWWLLLLLIPLVNIVIGIILNIELAKAFGKTWLAGLGLTFLPIIFFPWLAFTDTKYVGPQK